MLRRCVALLLLIFVIVSMTACAKCIATREETAEVVITETYYRPAWTQPVWNGKFFVPIRHPAVYRVTVMYEDVEYVMSGREVYDIFVNRIGDTAVATFEVRTYDDGTLKRELIKLTEG